MKNQDSHQHALRNIEYNNLPGTNGSAQATALGYDPNTDIAPKVLASGKGETAQKIIQIARANNIPIREDPILAEALAQVSLDGVIPPELYELVAEVLAFIYRIRENYISD